MYELARKPRERRAQQGRERRNACDEPATLGVFKFECLNAFLMLFNLRNEMYLSFVDSHNGLFDLCESVEYLAIVVSHGQFTSGKS